MADGKVEILQSLDFVYEATKNLEEVSYAIKEGQLSSSLPCEKSCVYINITTLEQRRFCIRLSRRGFEVMGSEYDSLDGQDNPDCLAFETVYSLLDNISPSYQSSFHDALADKLIRVQQTGDTTDKGHSPTSTED